VHLRDELSSCAPRLRRFGRALIGGQPTPDPIADDLVASVLARAARGSKGQPMASPELYLRLYTQIVEGNRARLATQGQRENENYKSAGSQRKPALSMPQPSRDSLSGALLKLALEEREALLLVVLEGFSYAQAARILKISRTVFITRLVRARAALGEPATTATTVSLKPVLPSYLQLVK